MKKIILLLLLVFLAEIATDIYVPVLPLFTKIFHTDLEVIQLTMSLHLLGFALGQPFYGPISDRYGRRKTLLFGFTLFVAATFLCTFSNSIETLIFFRFVQGFGACVAPVVGMAIVKDIYAETTENIKMLSLMSMTVSLSPIIGPILGTIIAEYSGWKGSFYLLSVSGMILLPFLYLRLNESHNITQVPQQVPKALIVPFSGLVLINALTVCCVWVFITAAPFILMENYQVPLLHYGYYQAFTVVAYILGGLITNRLVDIIGAKSLSIIGLITICSGSFGLFTLWRIDNMSALGFVGLVALMECGIGIFRPIIINKIMDCFPGRNGFSAAILGTTEMSISAVAIAIMGFSPYGTMEMVVGIFTVTTILTLVVCGIIYPKNPVGIITKS